MSAELKYWYLHDHKLFRNLSFAEIDGLCILKKFKRSKKNEIIELNGAKSEPTHIYDTSTSFWKGQREIFRHLQLFMCIVEKNRIHPQTQHPEP